VGTVLAYNAAQCRFKSCDWCFYTAAKVDDLFAAESPRLSDVMFHSLGLALSESVLQ